MVRTLAFLLSGLAAVAFSGACGCGEEAAKAPHDRVSEQPKAATDTAPKPYPLDKCLVSGEKLSAMGKPVVLVHEGQEIKFCCKDCIKEFTKDPGKYLKILQQGGPAEQKPDSGDHDHDGHPH